MLTAGRGAAALVRAVLAIALGVPVLAVVAGGALLIRLTEAPLDVTWLARQAVAVVDPGDGVASATLALQRAGPERLLRVVLTGLERHSDDEVPPATARRADVTLSITRLLRGQLAPRAVVGDGIRLNLVRQADGSFGKGGAGPGLDLSRLAAIHLTDVRVDVDDLALGQPWHLASSGLEGTQAEDGALHAKGQIEAKIGAVTAAAAVEAAMVGGQVSLRAALAPLSPAALAGLAPALAPAAALDAPVSLTGEAVLTLEGGLVRAKLHADVAAGTLALPKKGGGTGLVSFASAGLDAAGNADAVTIQTLRVVLAPPSGSPPSTITAAGTLTRPGGRLRAQLSLDIDHANIADMPALWPPGTGGPSRAWLTENMTAGTARDAHFTFTLEPKPDGSGVTVTEAAGGAVVEDATIWWLRPVPPIEHGRADLVLQGPDTLLITAQQGRLGNIALRGGTMRITGLTVKDQVSVIQGDLAGPVAEVLTLLANPKLELLSKRPFPVAKPSGAVTAHLTINLPLEYKLSPDQVGIHVQAKVTDAHLGGVAAGRDLNGASATIDVTNARLAASGAGLVERLPAKFDLGMDFTDGPGSQIIEHMTASLHGDERELKASGLDPGGVLTGTVAAAVDFAQRRDGRAAIKLDADLQDAAVATSVGWDKQAGTAGHVTVQAEMNHGRITAVDALKVEAPGLSVEGRSEVQAGKPSVLHIERGIVGRTSATGVIVLPQGEGDPYRVTLSGPRLDLTSQTQGASKPSPEKPADAKGPPYVLDLRFERVLVGGARGLGPVTLTADSDGRRIRTAHLVSSGPERLHLDLTPVPGGRDLMASAADLGTLLREAKLASGVNGGDMKVHAIYDDKQPGSPLNGDLTLTAFTVQGAPVVGKVLQGMTLYGLVDALGGPGLVFDRLTTSFGLTGSVLDVKEARASSSSLGVTVNGRMDFARGTLSLAGTVVPAYFFNSLPGRIPLLGRLFSPEKGGGVFAARYALTGKITDPALSLNPLATLTPGALRGIFDIFN